MVRIIGNMVSVASLNTWFSYFAGGPSRQSRLVSFHSYLQHQKHDVMCFQELFEFRVFGLWANTASFDTTRSAVANTGLVHHTNPKLSSNFFGQNSGLAIFSRYPIAHEYHLEFKNARFFSRKGVIAVDLETSPSTVLRCVTLHLEHANEEMKKAQILETRDFLKSLPSTPNVVVCGDFNVCSQYHASSVYPFLRNEMRAGGLARNLLEANETPTHVPTKEQKLTFLDHFFVSPSLDQAASNVSVVQVRSETNNELISDHCKISATLDVK